jgi:hypothetical protein
MQIPTTEGLSEYVAGLAGRPVEVVAARARLAPGPGIFYATYVDDAGRPGAVALVDAGFAAYAGGALAMASCRGARAAVRESELDPTLDDGFKEVMNVCAALLNAPGAAHYRLRAVTAEPPEDAAQILSGHSARGDWFVGVEGYGSGRFSILAS